MQRNRRKHVGRAISTILSALLVLGVLTQTPVFVKAQLTESFETGWGDWYPDMNYDPAYFNIDLSSLYAYDGSVSVGIGSHGLPSPPITGWIERIVPVPPNTPLTVDLSFQLYSEGVDSPREVLAYIGNNNPSDYPDFTLIGTTDQVADAWYEYTYVNGITTPPSGQIYVALGTFNDVIGFKTYWVDYIVIGGITVDNDPPDITNLQPTNQTTIANNQPLISADYTDASGVSVPSVVLEVDAANVTSFATVTDAGTTYTPSAPLSEGAHNLYVEATDMSSNQNKGSRMWWFTVDTLPPVISNEQPANLSSTGNPAPTISASFNDATSGTDMASVRLVVDSIDVTADATITPNSMTYVPSVPLTDGTHDAYLEVRDNSNPKNLGNKAWSFEVDTVPPIITNLQPSNNSQTGNGQPIIGASYSDPSGIDTGSVTLVVDTFDVTVLSTVTLTDISYTPSFPLTDGAHSAHLTVEDVNGNPSEAVWFFTVDATAPITQLNVLSPQYTDMGGNKFIASSTPLNLTWDDGSGTGVDTVSYKFYASGETEPGYSQYISDFTIPNSKSDGLIHIKFKSTDRLGNEEPENQEDLYLDNNAPITNVVVGTPAYLDSGTTFVKSSTTITLTANDGNGSGVSEIIYGIDDPGCPSPYTVPITLSSVSEGAHVIYIRASDNVDNTEPTRSFDVYLDETAPVTSIQFGGPQHQDSGVTYINVDTSIDFSADDGAGSGTASIWYKVTGVAEIPWTEYTGTSIQLSGPDGLRSVVIKSIDNLGNEESEKTSQVYLDTTPPVSSVPGYVEGAINFIADALTGISITADDGGGSGIGAIRFGIDDPSTPNTYVGPIVVGTMAEGVHKLYVSSVDNVGNEEQTKNITIVLDITPPTADAGENVEVVEGDTVALDGSGSNDDTSGISEYTWTFLHSGSTVTLHGSSQSFTFDDEGTYVITLTVKDNAGHESTDTMTVTVVAKASADFPWWIVLILIVVVVTMLLLFALFKRKKKDKIEPEEESLCEECGHVIGPHDRVCPECDTPVTMAPRR